MTPRRLRFLITVLVITVLVAVGFVAAACSRSSDTDPDTAPSDSELLDFALVNDNEFVFEADPTNPDRGIFHVRTTEPVKPIRQRLHGTSRSTSTSRWTH